MRINKIKVSYFGKPINNALPHDKAVTLASLYNFMLGNSEKLGSTEYGHLKSISDRALNSPAAKRELPYVTFSAEFERDQLRRLDSSYTHTSLFVMDIDKIDNAEEVFEASKSWENCVMSFMSPSGKGVKIVVAADLTESQIHDFGHTIVCSQIIDIIEAYFNVKVDPLKDATRACFIRATDKVFYNDKAQLIHINEDQLRIAVHEIGVEEHNEPLEEPITSRAMVVRIWKGTERRLGRLPKQSRYSWLVSFVTESHKKGISRDTLIKFMGTYVKSLPQMSDLSSFDLNDYTDVLTRKVYSKYQNEFGIHGEWFLRYSATYQYPIDGLDIVNSRLGDVAAFAAENFTEFFFSGGKFYKFNGRIFDMIDEDLDADFQDMIQAITVRDSASTKSQLVQYLKSRMTKGIPSLKSMPKMLFKNGVLDTSDWSFKDCSEQELLESRFVCQFDYNYNPSVSDDVWNRMVKTVMSPNEKLDKNDDSIAKEELLYDFLGYSLFGNGNAEQVLLFTGKGANGKSSLINAIIDSLPTNITESISPKQFGERFVGANLVGKIINIVPDIDYADLGNEAAFKKIVSNEPIMVEEKFKKPRKAELHCSHIFAANGDLQFKNNDNALDRRFLTILLEQVFYADERDFSLKDKLKADSIKQTIMNKAIEGWKRFSGRDCRFVVPESSQEAQRDRVKELDHTKSFFDNCLVFEEGSRVSFKDVIEVYNDWCMENNIMRSDRVQFNKFGGKLQEYIQYDAPKGAKFIRPKNVKHIKNMRVTSSKLGENLVEDLPFLKKRVT